MKHFFFCLYIVEKKGGVCVWRERERKREKEEREKEERERKREKEERRENLRRRWVGEKGNIFNNAAQQALKREK